MGKNMPNINPMSIVMVGRNQTGFIATYIENRQFVYFIGIRKSLTQFGE
jgi:hypothetical protein